jgi:hypothetical protein
MTADEQARAFLEDLSACVFFIMAGISSNVSDVNAKTFTFKVEIQCGASPDFGSVNVPVDPSERLERL